MPVEDDETLESILQLDTIAVVGCSATPQKEAHQVPKFLDERGYEIIPVNPYADEILGREAYDSLSAVEETVDIVDVFRPSEEVSGIVDEAVARDDVAAVWTQLGIRDAEAGERVAAAGKQYVEDKCLKVEYQRLMA
ncbi:YneT family protein [Natronomonas pharaonis DSM 2160]|uniref:YneT family protein n=1 Tax=Natronomonas pharaonis (strain ATCC 35678 / DSM 2160 / CIP 103997 / JCM 8858 / NBRC 14720 / NCIMB 2260 / Gabara) TaxID=348780 RepID=A0A1U7EYJ6_NATPD|nr:CoA-binding protein [Natronomonas pharaonis]CAI50327.1 YneT family protein [Natronomonas pharaonis DSM 2160]